MTVLADNIFHTFSVYPSSGEIFPSHQKDQATWLREDPFPYIMSTGGGTSYLYLVKSKQFLLQIDPTGDARPDFSEQQYLHWGGSVLFHLAAQHTYLVQLS